MAAQRAASYRRKVSIQTRPNVDIGDGDVARAHEILRTEVGSGVHGMAIPGTDDHDEAGVYIETPQQVIGLAPAAHHWVWRTKAQGERSGPGDVDLTMYGLRKFLRLALAGNPTIMIPLYARGEAVMCTTELGEELRSLAPSIVSALAGHRFLGYLHAQRERLLGGGKRNRVPNRPELIERYGYDTKYASHALRLGRQGLELMTTGALSLPLRPDDLAQCLAVKRGEMSQAQALALIDTSREELEDVMTERRYVVPDAPDVDAVNAWMVSASMRHWRAKALI